MSAKLEDLRKVKDNATRAIEKRNYARAAALYLEIAEREPEADWRQRAGEAFRKSGEMPRAVEQLELAANGYAAGGFLLKAIAVCKTILLVDPAHTATQRTLADLYAKRDKPTETKAAPPMLRPQPQPVADPSPLALEEKLDVATHAAPIDVLPLHQVLGGNRVESLEAHIDAGSYEIELGEDDLAEEAGIEIDVEAPPALPTIPLFSSLDNDQLHLLIERVALREAAAGDVIVSKGDPGGSLFVVVDGKVRVSADGRELALLETGSFFGELGLLTDEPRSATVEASEASRLLEISREVAWDVIGQSPDVLRTLLRFFRDRMLGRLIGSSPLFASLSTEDARSLAEQFIFVEIESGAAAVVQGSRAPGLYFVMCGEVEVTRDGERLGRLGPGEVFGEMSLLQHGNATADVRASRKTWVLQLPQARFQEIMVTYPQVLAYVSDLSQARASPAAAAEPSSLGLLDLLSDERIDML